VKELHSYTVPSGASQLLCHEVNCGSCIRIHYVNARLRHAVSVWPRPMASTYTMLACTALLQFIATAYVCTGDSVRQCIVRVLDVNGENRIRCKYNMNPDRTVCNRNSMTARAHAKTTQSLKSKGLQKTFSARMTFRYRWIRLTEARLMV